MAQTNDAFLKEKMNRFVDFMSACLKKHMENTRYTEFTNKLEELRGVDTAHFILHVTESMCPYKTNAAAYVSRQLGEHGLVDSDLSKEDFSKFTRFIECFIAIVSQ